MHKLNSKLITNTEQPQTQQIITTEVTNTNKTAKPQNQNKYRKPN